MKTDFTILAKQRELIAKVIQDTPEDDLLVTPTGRKNNIAWNFAHIVTIQQVLSYALSGQPLNVPAEYVALYSRDTSPADWEQAPDIALLLEQLATLPAQTAADYEAGKFANYKAMTTSTGIHLATVEEAIAFNNFHEGIHTGIILSIRKELART